MDFGHLNVALDESAPMHELQRWVAKMYETGYSLAGLDFDLINAPGPMNGSWPATVPRHNEHLILQDIQIFGSLFS